MFAEQERVEPEGFRRVRVFEDISVPLRLAGPAACVGVGNVISKSQQRYFHLEIDPF